MVYAIVIGLYLFFMGFYGYDIPVYLLGNYLLVLDVAKRLLVKNCSWLDISILALVAFQHLYVIRLWLLVVQFLQSVKLLRMLVVRLRLLVEAISLLVVKLRQLVVNILAVFCLLTGKSRHLTYIV